MDSLEALSQLRSLNAEKQRKKIQCQKVQSEIKKMSELQREKEALYLLLQSLQDGSVSTTHPLDTEEVRGLRLHAAQLKEKVSTHRVIGPCGLTVLGSKSGSLVVTLTGMWKDYNRTYMLRIDQNNGKFKVVGSTIPHFINVENMFDETSSGEPVTWSNLNVVLDGIGRLVSAYSQRKGELERLKQYLNVETVETDSIVVTSCTANEPVTVLEFTLSVPDEQDSVRHELHSYLYYSGLEATLPTTVDIDTDSTIFSKEVIDQIKAHLKSKPLSSALGTIIGEDSMEMSSLDTEASNSQTSQLSQPGTDSQISQLSQHLSEDEASSAATHSQQSSQLSAQLFSSIGEEGGLSNVQE